MSDIITAGSSDFIALVNEHVDLVAQRDAAADIVKKLERQIAAVEVKLENLMTSQGLRTFSSDKAFVECKEKHFPSVSDWEKVYQYILENEACYLLHKRISATAIEELQSAGVEIPGVEMMTVNKIKVSPIKQKSFH